MKKRDTPEQIVRRKLREADEELAAGTPIPDEVARRLGISEATSFHRWRNQYTEG
jgi:transposase-like protein